jgi:OOP family OmpA-OmpF porin
MTLDATKLFELNSARFIPPPPVELDNFAAAMIAHPEVTNVSITGHTDQLGSVAFNNRLSQQRADAVKSYLVSKGVAANRLNTRGMASTKLVVVCKEKTRAAMISCGAPNRRVEVEQITVVKR